VRDRRRGSCRPAAQRRTRSDPIGPWATSALTTELVQRLYKPTTPRSPGLETIMPAREKDLDSSETDDASDTRPRMRADSWRHRHALKVLGAVMVAMFATVIIAQVAC
jgi:hypothetical protein